MRHGTFVPEYIDKINSNLRKLDLEMKIAIANDFLMKEHKNTSELIVENGLNSLILNIQQTLEHIHVQLESHSNKWFANYRTLDLSKDLSKLDEYSTILDQRLDLLIKICSISSTNIM
jgi:hypothetical protein